MEIKTLTVKDAEIYRDYRLEALEQSPEAFASTYEETVSDTALENVRSNLASEESVTLGIFQEGRLSASAALRFYTLEKLKHKAHLLAMYVSPQARNKGYGKKLVEAAIEIAKERQVEQVQLAVVTRNKPAISFYESIGFNTYGVEKRALKYKDKYWDENHMVLFL
ncbi:GNAT family N-acetyltransferase [Evansella clarkii]|uniref:GNAT family N-acetyltransferase n=1 Tax=Evansella clarkii TaxID=79879 RepID=UPI000B454515|nr:GNAT family N-acetyltransferase [Evansella clarkii]